jgi:hypothetical protein
MPALISDWAPMMLRVRPPQLTITFVLGDGTRSLKRKTNSAPGTLTAVGMVLVRYSANERLSRTRISSPASISALSSAAVIQGVPRSCSTTSANALLGTCTPL